MFCSYGLCGKESSVAQKGLVFALSLWELISKALGMSCLLGMFLFVCGPWVTPDRRTAWFRWGIWVRSYQPDLWKGWRLRSVTWGVQPCPRDRAGRKALGPRACVYCAPWQDSACVLTGHDEEEWHCPQHPWESTAGGSGLWLCPLYLFPWPILISMLLL